MSLVAGMELPVVPAAADSGNDAREPEVEKLPEPTGPLCRACRKKGFLTCVTEEEIHVFELWTVSVVPKLVLF